MTAPTDEKGCQTCRFWFPPSEQNIADNGDDAMGECHRYPPQMILVNEIVESWYPDTYHDEWCGEYQPDSPQEVRRLDEPVQITAPPMSAPPLWPPYQPPVYGPGYDTKPKPDTVGGGAFDNWGSP